MPYDTASRRWLAGTFRGVRDAQEWGVACERESRLWVAFKSANVKKGSKLVLCMLVVSKTDLSVYGSQTESLLSQLDRDMIRRRGEAMACKLKGKGVPVALGPMMNLGRVAAGGRN
ncbi:hypothetical protein RhiTH_007547 [Rhizoctonia solani]